jgi:hypothetical protein
LFSIAIGYFARGDERRRAAAVSFFDEHGESLVALLQSPFREMFAIQQISVLREVASIIVRGRNLEMALCHVADAINQSIGGC